MTNRVLQRISTCLLVGLTLVAIVPLVGCEAKEQIRTYTVAKPAQNAATAAANRPASDGTALPSDDSGETPDRMLVAILPAGDRATFFKIVGPAAVVEARKKAIDEFFASIKAADDGQPTWKVPPGWKEDAGSGMRMATIWVPTDGKPLEISVTALPWRGTETDLISNVNRWRGQMQLQPIRPQQLKEVTSEIKAGDATITLVDLRGQFAGAGIMAPFAGGRGGTGSPTAPRGSTELPAGHPPIDSLAGPPRNTPAAENAAAAVPKFEAPKSWTPVAASGFRKAQFAIGSDANSAVVTLIDFPTKAGPLMTDPLANVNRWRGEIGLAKIEEGQLEESTEAIEINGKPAKYVRLIPDASKPEESKIEKATLAAMVTNNDKIWFIKLLGARDTVTAEEENFKGFLKSIQFSDGSGVSHGDK